ncbi:MAG TPA: hypothetical protein PLK90_07990 [Clostridiales bacterium]|jgi:hypothetical protein|nr:hypothetical protein [Clostridiales bacterium]HQP70324.1 hypothetical protein [Clostridiales bacterium]
MKIIITVILAAVMMCFAEMTLKEAYDSAGPGEGYDKLIILEKGKVYKGGLFIGRFFNPVKLNFEPADIKSVKIKGNGAIIDLMNGQIHTAYTDNKLDIDSCVIINGTVRYNGFPEGEVYVVPNGTVKNVTFYEPVDFGIRLEGAGRNTVLRNNLVANTVNTGGDFNQYHSTPTDIMRTGTSISFSIFSWYGIADIADNWSYNALYDKPLDHFSLL